MESNKQNQQKQDAAIDDDDFDSILDQQAQQLNQKKPQAQPQPQQQQQNNNNASGSANATVQDDLGLGSDIDFSKLNMNENEMAEAQKLFEEVMKQMNPGGGAGSAGADVPDYSKIFEGLGGLEGMGGFGGPTTASGSNQNTQGTNAASTDNSNPFLLACNQMFQDFDKISKEEQQQQIPKPSTGAGPQSAAGSTSGPQGMPNLEGLGGMGDDPMFMNLLNTFAKDLLNGDPSAQEGAFDSLMNQFSDFMKDTENNEEMKTALESVVQEIIKKDTLYEPMKTLRDEYPKWLEENWQTVNQEDLERYNKQLDKITEICNIYENNKSADETLVFEKLAELQELGSPPQDLMKKVGDQGFGPGNPFQNL